MPRSRSPVLTREDLVAGARVLWSLPALLRHPVLPAEARSLLRERLARREDAFLDLVRRAVFGNPASPYRELLAHAGCQAGDLDRLVRNEGVEGALACLYAHGVYLTADELKGRRAVRRGSRSIAVDPVLVRNPSAHLHLGAHTSGSRGTHMPVPLDLRFIREQAQRYALRLDAAAAGDWQAADWYTPGGAAAWAVRYVLAGGTLVRRFSQVDPASSALPARSRWFERLVRWSSLVGGRTLPRPVHVPPDAPRPVVEWMAGVLRRGGTPHLRTFTTSAVRVCQAAVEAGVSLEGARFSVTGEPLTDARLASIHRAGGEALPVYSSSEVGPIAFGCLAPSAPDDLHLLHDAHAVIQPGAAAGAGGLPPRALLMSSLRPTVPFVWLNVCLGDQADIVRRGCGCALERLGWTTHLVGVRSFEKLNAGGMTFWDSDVIRVLEEVLPARFGGGPTDYQLVEEEAPGGHARVRLLVHPGVGPIDAAAVADALLAALGGGSTTERVMTLQWRAAGTLRVDREAPRATVSGKVLHLHQPPGPGA